MTEEFTYRAYDHMGGKIFTLFSPVILPINKGDRVTSGMGTEFVVRNVDYVCRGEFLDFIKLEGHTIGIVRD